MDATCGDFVDSRSDTVVNLVVCDWSWAWHLCDLPGATGVRYSYSGAVPICFLEATNARDWQIVEYLHSHPTAAASRDALTNVEFSPAGSTVLHVQYLAPGGVLYLYAAVCDPTQRSRALSLMLGPIRLKPDAL